MYLLSVLSSDRTAEITFLLSLNSSYSTIPPALPSRAVSHIQRAALAHHTHRFYNPTYAGLITSLTAESQLGGSSRDWMISKDSTVTTASSTKYTGSKVKSSTTASTSGLGSGSGTQQASQSQTQTQAGTSRTEDDGSGTLRSQYGRFLPPPPTSPPSRHAYLSALEEVLGKYYNMEREAGRQCTPGVEVEWVYLATPFVCCFARPVAVFLAFQKLMDRMSE